jgi:group I intron endonuclease
MITNKITDAGYIGSTTRDVGLRWYRHKKDLKSGIHHSAFLQRAWDKYGEAAFEFSVVEIVEDNSQLLAREQAWLDNRKANYPQEKNYNLCWTAGSNLGLKHSLERVGKASARMMGSKRDRTSVEKQQKTWAKKYGKAHDLRSPDGVIYRGVNNLRAFARMHGLTSTALALVTRGILKQHKGWTLASEPPLAPRFSFIDPDGVIHDNIERLDIFCQEHDLPYKSMSDLHRGKRKSIKGWRKHE